MQVELTKDEAEKLVNLIDVAVKAGGLQLARVAWELTDKIVQASQAEAEAPVLEEEADG